MSSLLVSLVAGTMIFASALKLAYWSDFVAWLESMQFRWLPSSPAAVGVIAVEGLAAALLLTAGTAASGLALAASIVLLILAVRFLTREVSPLQCACLGNAGSGVVKKVVFAMAVLATAAVSALLANGMLWPGVLDTARMSPVQSCIAMLVGAYIFRDSPLVPAGPSSERLLLSADAQGIIEARSLTAPGGPTLIVFVTPGCQGCAKLLELILGIEAMLPGDCRTLVHIAGSPHGGSVMGARLEIISEDVTLMDAFAVRATPSLAVLKDGEYALSAGLAGCIAALGGVIATA
ncbi:MauE/DoxX family redox-associated membrane protein [Stenotrophomonas sp. CFBP8980]|uniref:MauE/DoxX family redox-associated membrane protein n=1 Tax=Stenotrophomonas sp. CFBP8980 TaxID=3096523 RepID=UPI002A6A89AB|nr:MauE/DoxX family redox-associated membrane protein [Stenotrophomonas sp. CFBP8980]